MVLYQSFLGIEMIMVNYIINCKGIITSVITSKMGKVTGTSHFKFQVGDLLKIMKFSKGVFKGLKVWVVRIIHLEI
ncbi:hypothetical protein GIB67_001322 [Kingdonia uniflora]|uniref:Uncharacterized protein n=1 Tax=Kingdonia uniflora TaxID=39325 RepID=A0A7J7LLH3_9MAGN|nr:hypothetical protein GIB67_001322 [Kingdonia uniflora]